MKLLNQKKHSHARVGGESVCIHKIDYLA